MKTVESKYEIVVENDFGEYSSVDLPKNQYDTMREALLVRDKIATSGDVHDFIIMEIKRKTEVLADGSVRTSFKQYFYRV